MPEPSAQTTALSAYLAGVAMLGPDETATVDELIAVSAADVHALRDAQDLLRHVASEEGACDRAMLLVERAITRVEQSRRLRDANERLRETSRATREESARARRERERRGDRP